MITITVKSDSDEELDQYLQESKILKEIPGTRRHRSGATYAKVEVTEQHNERGAGRKKSGQEVNLVMVNLMRDQGQSLEEIAKFYGISRKTLYLRLKELENDCNGL